MISKSSFPKFFLPCWAVILLFCSDVVVISIADSTTTSTSAAPSTASSSTSLPPPIMLTPTTFEDLTTNKTVFIMFYAPYCAHSQNLMPTWNRLRLDRQPSRQGNNNSTSSQPPVGLVAQVDCTSDRLMQKWCDQTFRIIGFPTLLFGDPSMGGIFLREYNGDKDYESLSHFANDTLSYWHCTPANLHHCDTATREKVQSMLQMSDVELDAANQEIERELDNIERNFRKEFQQMQAQYDTYLNQFELDRASIKDKLKVLQAVKSLR